MDIKIDERWMIWMLYGYFKGIHCYESLTSLMLETNISEWENCPDDLTLLQRLILQGRYKTQILFNIIVVLINIHKDGVK